MRFDAARDICTRSTIFNGRVTDIEMMSALNSDSFMQAIVGAIGCKVVDSLMERIGPSLDKAIKEAFATPTKGVDDASHENLEIR